MCYGDRSCAIYLLKKDGLTDTEARATLEELIGKVESGELEVEEALASVGLDNRFAMALQDWPG